LIVRGWLKTDVEPIDPDDGEETVKVLRQHLREAQQSEARGDRQRARRARAQADEKLVAVAKMLENRFGRYAKGAFGDKLPHLIEEAVGEMFTRLCSELKDLEPRAELYEKKFNLCVKRRVIVDAIRRVRRQHGMPSQGDIEMWDYVPKSVQASEEEAEAAAEEEAYPIQPADPEATAAFEEVILAFERMAGKRLARELLARLEQKYRDVLMLRTMQGLTWEEVADRVGVNWRTAMRRHDRAVETLKQILDERG
jgi:RNA polymerase sigma factor (sigma-70 family)